MEKLTISHLSAEVAGNEILSDLSLTVNKGDCLALLGPNGHGKSTLLNVIMGSPAYKVTSGSIDLDGEDILAMKVDERSKNGLFSAFQYPPDVPGVIASDFFKASINAHRDEPISAYDFRVLAEECYARVGLSYDLSSRHLNEGFSGGEKKRDEILQMLMLRPKIALLDEIDSGLDVDALNQIASIINELREEGTTFIMVSHYDRLYDLINTNRTAVMVNGKVVLEGGNDLVKRIAKEGYSFLRSEYGIDLAKRKVKMMDSNSPDILSLGVE